jgi:hypothetical protein
MPLSTVDRSGEIPVDGNLPQARAHCMTPIV